MKCYVCGQQIGYLGWPKHVEKEKRIHGKDIYLRLKAEREGKLASFLENINREGTKEGNKTLQSYKVHV